eukprot:SAG31_NODE_9_length_42330_cov_441.979162_27_plen_34_part_00
MFTGYGRVLNLYHAERTSNILVLILLILDIIYI